jgi:hypothetical protein
MFNLGYFTWVEQQGVTLPGVRGAAATRRSGAACGSRVPVWDAMIDDFNARGFHTTPIERADALSDALGFTADGGVFVKDETHNVSGSHKARHLITILLLPASPPSSPAVRRGRRRPTEPPTRDRLVRQRGDRREHVVARSGQTGRSGCSCRSRPTGRRRRACTKLARARWSPARGSTPTRRRSRACTCASARPSRRARCRSVCRAPENALVPRRRPHPRLGDGPAHWRSGSRDRRSTALFVQVGGGALAACARRRRSA